MDQQTIKRAKGAFFYSLRTPLQLDPNKTVTPFGHLLEPMPHLVVEEDDRYHTNRVSNSKSSINEEYHGFLEKWDESDLFKKIWELRKNMGGTEKPELNLIRSRPSQSFAKRHLEGPEVLHVGCEKGVEGRFNNNSNAIVLKAIHQLRKYDEQFPLTKLGDWDTVDVDVQPKTQDSILGRSHPDFAVCRVDQVAVCLGEVVTAWTFNILDGIIQKESKVNSDEGTSLRLKIGMWTFVSMSQKHL